MSSKPLVTIVGTLPPIKGVSAYNKQLLSALAPLLPINFLGFSALYPEWLFPGGKTTEENDPVFTTVNHKNLTKNETLTWYNPFSWIFGACRISTPLVHVHIWTTALFPILFTIMLISKARGKKVLCTVHNVVGHESNFLDRSLLRILYTLANRFVLHSTQNAQQLQSTFGISDHKIAVIPRGIYNFYISGKISRDDARSVLSIPANQFVFLYFGHIRKYKGISTLLQAYKMVAKEYPHTKLIIAGQTWTDWEEHKQVISSDPLLSQHVTTYLHFIPTQEVERYFRAANVLILPYHHFESQSGPGNIALAADLPLIVSNVGGLPDLVRSPELTVPPEDSQSLATAMKRIISDKKLYDRAQKQTTALKNENGWDKTARSTIQLYEKMNQATK